MPIRTMVCTCPEGYVTDENGGCRTLPPIVSGCERDDECNDQTACINAVCRDPCGCGLNARCDIVEHRPVCICEPGFYGKLISLISDFVLSCFLVCGLGPNFCYDAKGLVQVMHIG